MDNWLKRRFKYLFSQPTVALSNLKLLKQIKLTLESPYNHEREDSSKETGKKYNQEMKK